MSTKAELSLKSALLSTGLVQPVESTGKGGQVSVLCRQVPGQDKPWLQVARELLITAGEASCELHLCRRYLVKDGQMVFGWHISFSTKGTKAAEELVAKLEPVLAKARPSLASADVEERPAQTPARHTTEAPPVESGHRDGVRLVSQTRDAKGRLKIVQEIPLPHVHRDLNVPQPGKRKGAYGSSDDTDIPGGR